MRTSQFMYEEVKAALYRYVPITVSLGTAGPKQAFNIGRRPVNFRGTNYLEELARCRTVKLKNGFKGDYVAKKPEQVKDEIGAFLEWWSNHVEGNHTSTLEVHLDAYGILSTDAYGYGETLSLRRLENWLLTLSPATRKTFCFVMSRLLVKWNGSYDLSEHVKEFWKNNQDLVRSSVPYSVATAPAQSPTVAQWPALAPANSIPPATVVDYNSDYF